MAENEAMGHFEEALREVGRGIDEAMGWMMRTFTQIPERQLRIALIEAGYPPEKVSKFLKEIKEMKRG